MACATIAIAYAYNSNLVRAEDVPKSALDFLTPTFQGKLMGVLIPTTTTRHFICLA